MPGHSAFARVAKLPPVEPKKIPDIVKFEAVQQIPFPIEDSLYGMRPDPTDDYGVQLGAMALRGERGTLIVTLDSLIRMSSNPFFPYMRERIDESVGRRAPPGAGAAQAPATPPPTAAAPVQAPAPVK